MRFILNDPDMVKAGAFKSECLTAASGAKFEGKEAHSEN